MEKKMGILDNIFGPKEVTVSHEELENWLNKESVNLLSDVSSEINRISDKMKDAISEAKPVLEALKAGKLLNENIPEREKQIMIGNRDVYVKKTASFFDELILPENDYTKLEEFASVLDAKITEYHNSTARSYYVLTNFFDHEMKELAAILKRIETCVHDCLRLTKNPKVINYRLNTSRARELHSAITQAHSAEEELRSLETELSEEKKHSKTLNEKMNSLKSSKDFSEYKELEDRKKAIEADMHKLNSRILNDLQIFARAAKKFSQGNNLLAIYLENPLKALSNDPNLEIMPVIQKVKMEVSFGHIDVKQRDKLMSYELSRKYFEDAKAEYDKQKHELSDASSRQNRLTIMMDYKEQLYRVECSIEKIKRLEKDIEERKSFVFHLDVESKRKNLEDRLLEFTKKRVKIS